MVYGPWVKYCGWIIFVLPWLDFYCHFNNNKITFLLLVGSHYYGKAVIWVDSAPEWCMVKVVLSEIFIFSYFFQLCFLFQIHYRSNHTFRLLDLRAILIFWRCKGTVFVEGRPLFVPHVKRSKNWHHMLHHCCLVRNSPPSLLVYSLNFALLY